MKKPPQAATISSQPTAVQNFPDCQPPGYYTVGPYPTGTPSFVRQSKVVEAPGPDRNAQLPTQSAQMPFAEETLGSQTL